jgi:two-component sensor histidine kinase
MSTPLRQRASTRGGGYPTGIELSWKESGGPAVTAPTEEGFGSRLLKVTAAELGGVVDVNWNPGGLHWSLLFPLRSADFELAAT